MFVGLGYVFGYEDKGLLKHVKGLVKQVSLVDKGMVKLTEKTAPAFEKAMISAYEAVDKAVSSSLSKAGEMASTYKDEIAPAMASVTKEAKQVAEASARMEEANRKTAESANAAAKETQGYFGSLKATMDGLVVHNLFSLRQGLSALASGPVNQLTTGLQQQMMTFDKSFAKMAGSMGMVGPEFEKAKRSIFKDAYAINMDVNTAAEAFVAFKKAGLEAGDAGLSSFQSLYKFVETSGVQAADLAKVTASLRKSYGFTQQESASFFDGLIAQSTALGIGTEAFGTMASMLGEMDTAFSKTLAQEGPAAVQKATSSILRLSGAMIKAVGATPQEALEKSTKLFGLLAEEAVRLPQMAAGLDGDLGKLMTDLAIDLPGGFQEAFSLAQDSPDKFVERMSVVFGQLRKAQSQGVAGAGNAIQRLLSTLGPLGESMVFMVDSGDSVVDAFKEVDAAVAQSTETMDGFAKKTYRANLTLDEQLSRVRDRFATRLRGIAKNEIKGFVDFQTQAYGTLGDKLEQFASDSGPLGTLTKKLIGLAIVGPASLAPMLDVASQLAPVAILLQSTGTGLSYAWSGVGAVFGGVAKTIGSVAGGAASAVKPIGSLFGKILSMVLTPFQAFGKLTARIFPFLGKIGKALSVVGRFIGPVIGLLGSPILIKAALIIGGIATAFMLFKAAISGSFGPNVEKIAKSIGKGLLDGMAKLTGMLTNVTAWFKSLDPKKIAQTIAGFFTSAFAYVGSLIQSGSGGAGGGFGASFMTVGWVMISALGEALWEGSKLLLGIVWELAKMLGVVIYDAVVSTDWGAIGLAMWNGLKSGFNLLATKLPQWWAYFKAGAGHVGKLVGDWFGGIDWGKLWNNFKKGLSLVVGKAVTMFKAIDWGAIATLVVDAFKWILSTAFGGLFPGVQQNLTDLMSLASAAWDWIKASAATLLPFMIDIFTRVKDGIVTAFDVAKSAMISVFTFLSSTATTVFDTIRTAMTSLAGAIGSVLGAAFDTLKSMLQKALPFAQSILSTIFGTAAPTAAATTQVVASPKPSLASKVQADAVFTSMLDAAQRQVDLLKDILAGLKSQGQAITKTVTTSPNAAAGSIL